MAQDPSDRRPDEGRPVLSGLAALVVAALGISIILAGGLFVGTRLLGSGGATDSEGTPSSGQTLVIPDVTPEAADEEVAEPPISDTPRPSLGDEEPTGSPTEQTGDITLSSASDQVAPGAQLDLAGTYPGAPGGTRLEVQQLADDGTWGDFDVQATVRGGSYTTYIFTQQVGDNTYRMTDPGTGESSNEIEVTIG